MTLQVITHTYFDDTVQTDLNYNGLPAYQAVGNMSDPFFGTMTASTFFQIVPGSPGYDPWLDASITNLTIDSAVMVLPYTYGSLVYGDTSNQNLTQTYQVFYMLDTMGYYSIYYSFSNKAIDALNPISDPVTINTYHLMDSSNISGVDHAGLRIHLNNYFIGILKLALANSYAASDPSASFLTAFNGICVRPSDSREMSLSMPYFVLNGVDQYSTAGVILYYHYYSSTTGTYDTVTQLYEYNNEICTHFNQINKSYSRYPVNALINSGSKNDSIIALQNQPGASFDVKVYGINAIPKGVVINKAELQFTMLGGQYNPPNPILGPDSLGPPTRLYPTAFSIGNGKGGVYPDSATAANQIYLVADRYPVTSTTPLEVMDGYLHTFPGTSNNVFTVDIPRELMQAIVEGSDSLHFHINGTQDFYGAFHLVAAGGGYSDSTLRAKFVITYSKLSH